MFDLEQERRHTPEPDLVPILDGLTAVIFFLLSSLSFIGITKITVPPSKVSVASTSNDVPVSGRVKAKLQGNSILVKLEWLGKKPGAISENAIRIPVGSKNESLIAATEKLGVEFKEKFPEEKTLQIALSSELNYQELISIMDGLRKNENFVDLVLSSYTDAD